MRNETVHLSDKQYIESIAEQWLQIVLVQITNKKNKDKYEKTDSIQNR